MLFQLKSYRSENFIQKGSGVKKQKAGSVINLIANFQKSEELNIIKKIGWADNFSIKIENDFTKFFGQKNGKISYYFCFTKNRQVKIFF
jgi:hypothetical protein